MLTPDDVHYGRAARVLEKRRVVLAAAYAAHPERFVQRVPTPRELPTKVWINPPQPAPTSEPEQQQNIRSLQVR